MSSKSNKIAKTVENRERQIQFDAEHCLLGSILLTLGKLSGQKEKQIYQDFSNIIDKLPQRENWNVRELCDWIINNFYKIKEDYKQNLVLVYDNKGVMSPLVTIMTADNETGEDNKIWPVASSGEMTGILLHEDRLAVEKIYDD